jgi:hypothetical protein
MHSQRTQPLPLTLVCSKENDLYRVLEGSGYSGKHTESLLEALRHAPASSAVLVLADAYPRPEHIIDDSMLDLAASKRLRLYLEYPARLAGLAFGEPQLVQWERLVVASDFFAPALPTHRILVQHGCWFLPTTAQNPDLVVARVAGYRKAVFGLPEEAQPILFQLPEREVLVATTKLSQFVTGRYAPAADWRHLWECLLAWLMPASEKVSLQWTPAVSLQASPDAPLAETAEEEAWQRSVHWFRNHALYSVGKKGVIEGFESAIDYQGRQNRRTWIRADCLAESALVFAWDWAKSHNPESRLVATQILDNVWSSPDFYQDDPHSPAYGLVNWYARGQVFYGDDNARVILPTLAASRLLATDQWDMRVMRCLLANLRTSGTLGFRRSRIDMPFPAEGWRFFRNEETVYMAPHFEAYLWACFIWAYALTGYSGFLERTLQAIRTIMQAYPNWKWTNGLSQEMARMLLPLAFLVEVDDSHEHRGWLQHMVDELLALQQPCGAIVERLGLPGLGRYSAPTSNAAYGTREASVLQENGDPACDLLYTTNYALLGLHEAAAVTGDQRLAEAEDELAAFLCRIQVRSAAHPYLDGAWMRSFDFDIWEYWGSSADAGWGAWCVESGWTNSWIAVVLAMRSVGATLFDCSIAERLRPLFPALVTEMMDEHEKKG